MSNLADQRNYRFRFSNCFSGLGFLAAIAMLLVFGTTTAEAQTQSYSLAGAFAKAEGFLIRLPVIGNDNSQRCLDMTWHAQPAGGGMDATVFPVDLPPFGPVAPMGCIPSNPQVVTVNTGMGTLGMGMGGRASFMLPIDFFVQPEDDIPNKVIVPFVPNIISLTTDLSFHGPLAGPVIPIARQATAQPTTTTNFAVWNQFRDGAWTTQSTRAGLNFTWCLGNKNCTTVNQGTGLIRYDNPLPTGFGGTMSVLLAPGDVAGSLPVIGGAGGAGGPNSLLIIPVQAPIAQGGGGPGDLGGKGYAAIQVGMAGPGKVYASYMISAGGFLTSVQPPGGLFPVPGSTNTSNQMPFTTGNVFVRNVISDAFGRPGTFTFTAAGNDGRTSMGIGNIQLVAGSMRFSNGAGTRTPGLTAMSLSFVPEPGSLGLLAAGGLFLIGMTRMRRS